MPSTFYIPNNCDMEEPSFSHHGDQGYPSEQRESHWQPALRPENGDGLVDQEHDLSESTSLQHHQISESHQSETEPSNTQVAKDTNENFFGDENDGQLDPAWGFKRTDSEHLLNSARRSSSFPQVPQFDDLQPSHQEAVNGLEVLSDEVDFSQFAGGANAGFDEVVKDYTEDDEVDFSSFANNAHAGTHDITEDQPNLGQENEISSGYERPFELDQNEGETLDNRFEEGLPLIPNSEAKLDQESIPMPNAFQSSVFDDVVGGDEESSFFSQMQNQTISEKPQEHVPLERKSTDEVLGAMNLQQREKQQDAVEISAFQFDGDGTNDLFQDLLKAESTPSEEVKGNNTNSGWAAVLDDDEFLIEDDDELLPDSEPGSPSSFIASLKEKTDVAPDNPNNTESSSSMPQTSTNPYAPLSPKAHGNIGITRPGLAPMTSFQNHLQQPQIVNRAESFADQAKGGYKSPYDLPMDIKPKKRAQPPRVPSQPQGVPPPPRSGSMSSQKQLQSPFSPTATSFGQTHGPSVTSPPLANRVVSVPAQKPANSGRQSSTSSFFEELPVTSKPRATPNAGRYTPSHNVVAPPLPLPVPSPPSLQPPETSSIPTPQPTDPYAQFQLQPPERLDPYANIALQPPSLPAPSASSSRYSPAPGTGPGAPRPTASPRYSPAPPMQAPAGPGRYASQPSAVPSVQGTGNRHASQPSQPPPPTSTLPFMPRTSSPLAYQAKPPVDQTSSLMPPPPLPTSSYLPQSTSIMQPPPRQSTPPPVAPLQTSGLAFSPARAGDAGGAIGFTPPRRSQTQSPTRNLPRPALPVLKDNARPASAYGGQVSTTKAFGQPDQTTAGRSVSRTKPVAPEFDFEQPQDETQHDPLQRWRGAPIFKFGFGGSVVSSFPKHTPRYKAGQLKPQIKSTAGEVKTRISKDLSLLPEHVVNFPGPLKGKNKKKDVLNWMNSTIMKLETEAPVILGAAQTLPDPRKCHDELVLLWKIVRIIVEHDGVIENKPEALKAINVILSPEVHAIDESTASQYRNGTEPTGIYSPAGANVRSEATDPLVVESLRKHLLKGEREQAIWKAADARLWSHALLLASTIRDERKLWKQVVQEFVRQEVKTIGNNSESLSTLYEIFGGNMEESIDQLVPPSARAGLQMVSTVDTAGPTKNALDGLDKWKETLSLVLNNRTPEDQRALATLGSLLGNYGRVQAAHICFLFARSPMSPSFFGGVDDPQASITLLGSDQRAKPFSFYHDQDAILLTEIYEFAVSTLAPATMAMSLPHLASFKFQRALDLADNGMKTEAQAYCDAIGSGVTSKAKVSPYYNPTLLLEVDDLAKRLRQVPVQSTSWMTKPSVEKATSSLLSKLSNFVAGDDSDAESKGSGADIGPFARSTESPGISRSGSQTDLYNSYPSMTPAMPVTAASSRYAPGGIHSARSSSDLTRGRASLDSQRSPPGTSHGYEPRTSMYGPSLNHLNQSPARSVNSYQPLGTSPSRSNYQPTPPQPSYMPDLSANTESSPSHEPKFEPYVPVAPEESPSYMPTAPELAVQQEDRRPSYGGYHTRDDTIKEEDEPQPEEASTSGYEQPQSYGYGYEPPADTGYVPYQPDPESDDDSKKQKPKKKSFMDDDQDNYSRISSQTTKTSTYTNEDSAAVAKKKANDEAADAAFRAAAEADAQRAKEEAAAKKGSGWFGGWLGGKKADASLDAPKSSGGGDQKVHRAKLGEDKMKLYYDKDLKKWVNPDDPDSMKAKGATPPPPPGRSPAPPVGGPPRLGGTPAPPMINSRASTPASTAGGENAGPGFSATIPPSVSAGLGLPGAAGTPTPPGSSGGPPPPAGGLAPPNRPLSNASSIDDLIGPAASRKGAKGARGAKKGRYVDVMAQ